MVRVLLFFYVLSQILIVIQINWHDEIHQILPMFESPKAVLDVLKIVEIVTFIPIILILAQRTRELRKEVFHKEHLGPDF